MKEIRPLPRRTMPYPYEDLHSLLRRIAMKMGYEHFRWILRPQAHTWNIDVTSLPILSRAYDYSILHRLLRLSEETLYQHTLHRFAVPLQLYDTIPSSPQAASDQGSIPRLLLTQKQQQDHFLPIHMTRVCPFCLQEKAGYDRLYWRLHIITHCPHHRVSLYERCPTCHVAIQPHRPVSSTCPSCHSVYTTFSITPLAQTHPLYIGEMLVLKALAIFLPEHTELSQYLTDSPLRSLTDAEYLYFLRTMTAKLTTLFTTQELILLIIHLRICSIEDISMQQDVWMNDTILTFSLFHWLFLDWPKHCSVFLEVLFSISTPPYRSKERVGVRIDTDYLFDNPYESHRYPWLHEWYQHSIHHYQYEPLPAYHLRLQMNELAQTPFFQSSLEAKSKMYKQQRVLYIPLHPPKPIIPSPWEDLSSVLSRAAHAMDHPYPTLIMEKHIFATHLLALDPLLALQKIQMRDTHFLSYLLQIPPEQLPSLSYTSLVTRIEFKHQSVFTQDKLLFWLEEHSLFHATQVCPCCFLQKESYERLFWKIRGILTCPVHNVRMIKRCPTCHQHIPAMRRQRDQCPFCQRSTLAFSAPCLPHDSLMVAGTSLLLTMLHLPPTEASTAYEFLAPSPLLVESSETYFILLITITGLLEDIHSQEQLLHFCSVLGATHEIPHVQAEVVDDIFVMDVAVLLFHTIFSQWPLRFFSFLDLQYRLYQPRYPYRDEPHWRWRWILTRTVSFITPPWLLEAFFAHELQYEARLTYDSESVSNPQEEDS